ncbi:MAG: response regulator [Verrucomicrobiota bacterium]
MIIRDWIMPRVDGIELCRRIRGRRHAKYTYCIRLTARNASEENQVAAMEAGVDDCLSKPLRLHELSTRLRVADRILRSTSWKGGCHLLLLQKVRDDQNYWQQSEHYLSERARAKFSNAICTDCYEHIVIPQLDELGSPPAS